MPAHVFTKRHQPSGATKDQITSFEDVNKLLDMYYEQRGWSENGLPKAEKLESLGLKAVVA